MKQVHVTIIVFFSLVSPVSNIRAQKNNIEKSGKILRIGLPATAVVTSFVLEGKKKGVLQAAATFGTTFLTTHLLKRVIDKERPDGEKYAFPSGHTSISFSAAAFMQKRYGWNYGIPFYLLAGYVGWTRVNADRHDYWDVLGGAAVGIGCAYLFTKPYKESKIDVMFEKSKNSYMVEVRYKF
jgi:membrane-associated phospholipid phosphatase